MLKNLFKKVKSKICVEDESIQDLEKMNEELEEVIAEDDDDFKLIIKYRDENGDIHVMDWTDENFDMVMSNRNNQLIFN